MWGRLFGSKADDEGSAPAVMRAQSDETGARPPPGGGGMGRSEPVAIPTVRFEPFFFAPYLFYF
jgi:hypothetical protein